MLFARIYPELELYQDKAKRGVASRRVSRLILGAWQSWGVFVGLLVLSKFVPIDFERYLPLPRILQKLLAGVVLGCAIAVFAVFATRHAVRRKLRRELVVLGVPLCVECGYDLRALVQGRCPECGGPVELGKDAKCYQDH